jgi:hypothetical protein
MEECRKAFSMKFIITIIHYTEEPTESATLILLDKKLPPSHFYYNSFNNDQLSSNISHIILNSKNCMTKPHHSIP